MSPCRPFGEARVKTDSQVKKDVAAELKWNPAIDATKIGVEVTNGIVTLSGTVGTYAEKWAVEKVTQRVVGVKGLAVEIEVAVDNSGLRTDVDIARSAEQALQWVTYLPNGTIKVMVEKGWLTLSGAVDWDYQRQTGSGAVRYLAGVKGISDNIVINPTEVSKETKSGIEAALARRSDSDDQNISVEVSDGDVTLTGTVTNLWERELARETAWSAPGVRHVVDNLSIAY
jgi:osmotically-inducible protein OsmY